MEHGLAAFVVIGGQSHAEKAEVFLQARKRVLRFLQKNRPPFIAKIYASGKVGLWLDEGTWRQG